MIMKHIHYLDEKTEEVTEAGAHGIKIRTVIGEKDGAPNFYMRVVSFEPGGGSPSHSHSWEHETFVLSGKGTAKVDGEMVDLKQGDVVYVPPNAEHHFEASEAMEMI
jgi:quercetin dioxygenase-like cupin family protein